MTRTRLLPLAVRQRRDIQLYRWILGPPDLSRLWRETHLRQEAAIQTVDWQKYLLFADLVLNHIVLPQSHPGGIRFFQYRFEAALESID